MTDRPGLDFDAFLLYAQAQGLTPSIKPVEGSADAWSAWQSMEDDERETYRAQVRASDEPT